MYERRKRRETHMHFSSPSIIWKALSSINQSCMHYKWLSVHPSTCTRIYTHTHARAHQSTHTLFQNHDQVKKKKERSFLHLVPLDNICFLKKTKQNCVYSFTLTPTIHLICYTEHNMVKLLNTRLLTIHRIIITTEPFISHLVWQAMYVRLYSNNIRTRRKSQMPEDKILSVCSFHHIERRAVEIITHKQD